MVDETALLFPWSDAYSVKISSIDVQHRNLVNIINELHHAMLSRTGKDQLGGILSKLIQYTQAHFRSEEAIMQANHYPDLIKHKAEHERLTQTVLDFQRKFQRSEVGLTIEVMEFLKGWLANHILIVDKQYAPFLNSKGVR